MEKQSLIFVYNANSSMFSQATDYVHKIVSPKTYNCNLCKLTYDNLGVKKEWKHFIQGLTYPVNFLHKDEFVKQYPDFASIALPTIFIQDSNQKIQQLITSDEINKQQTLPDLEQLVKSKISA